MIKISAAEFIVQVRAHATKLPPGDLDPLVALLPKAKEETLEGRTVARAIVGIIKGHDFDEADVFAFGRFTLGCLAEFAERWSQGVYSDAELTDLVKLLERPG